MKEMDDTMKQTAVYQAIVRVLNSMNFEPECDDEELNATFSVYGDDLEIRAFIEVNKDLNCICMFSDMPFKVKEEKLQTMMIALNAINQQTVFGTFCLGIDDNKVFFKNNLPLFDTLMGDDEIQSFIVLCLDIIDVYNTAICGLSNGNIDLETFLRSI